MRIRRVAIVVAIAVLLAAPALVGTPDRGVDRPAPTVAPSELAALLADFRAVAPDPAGIDATGRSSAIGRFRLDLSRGAVYPLRTPRGEVLGILFQGRGRYRYRSADAFDRLTLAVNLSAGGRSPALEGDTVSDEFERLVIFFACPAFEDLWRPGAGPAPALSPGDRLAFDRIWRTMTGPGNLGFDHLAAEARLNGPGLQYVEAEIEGDAGPIGYHYEYLQDMQENLFRHREVKALGIRQIQPISRQAIDPGDRPLPPPLLLIGAHIEVSTGDNLHGRIASDLTFAVLRDGLAVVRLPLMNHRDRTTLRWDSGGNRLSMRAVTDGEGRALAFSHRYREILVALASPATRGDTLRLRFEADGEVLVSRGGEREENYFYLLYDPWFPRPSGW